MKFKILTKDKDTITDFKQFLDVWNNESDFINQQSSGSTGPPKLIEIPKWKMKASAEMTGTFFELERLNNSLLCISPNYIGGKMMIVRSILYNLELLVADISSNPIKDLNDTIDFAAMVPLQVDTILKESPEKLDLIKYLIIGGAPVSLDIEEQLQNRKCQAYSTYGMTETVSHIALKELDDKKTPFKAIGETSFTEINGELIINSPQLKIKGLHTNDIVDLIDEHHFHWKGRKDFVINSGGVKVHPEILEQKIKNEIKVKNFIISGLSDVTYGEKIILICEKSVFSKINKLVDNWPFDRYEKPKEVYVIDQLALTKAGKIDRIASKHSIIHD
jgi:O-succinylbenzoic acid--CoA ligase